MTLAAMGLSIPDPLVALDEARAIFDGSQDLTLAIEEEFQIVDPETHGLVNRFTELKARADATPLGEHTAGELISSEIEVKTGRCESFPEAARALIERRRDLLAEADAIGVALAACGTHPWSPWWEQEVIDTPHYRDRRGHPALRRVAQQHVRHPHPHRRPMAPIAPMAFNNAMRSVLPDLLALSASSPWYEGRYTHLHSTRSQLFTRMFPRCGIPEPFAGWADYDGFVRWLVETKSIKEHTEIWWCVNARVVRHGRAAQRRRARRRARIARRDGLRVRALGATAACDRRGRAASRAARPAHRGEHVACDPLGSLGRADRLRARDGVGAGRKSASARSSPTRPPRWRRSVSSRNRSCSTGCSKAVTRRSARSRRSRAGTPLEELFADQVRVTRESVETAFAQEVARG